MNTLDIMKYGHQTVLDSIKNLADEDWEKPGVCGSWSVKDILAHLASYEAILVESLELVNNPDADAPTLNRFLADYENYNDTAVDARYADSIETILDDYHVSHAKAITLLQNIPVEKRRENGIIAWYGDEYDLEDFIVYMYYAHKREHSAQIEVFRDQLTRLRALQPVR